MSCFRPSPPPPRQHPDGLSAKFIVFSSAKLGQNWNCQQIFQDKTGCKLVVRWMSHHVLHRRWADACAERCQPTGLDPSTCARVVFAQPVLDAHFIGVKNGRQTFASQTLRALPGYPGKNPGTSRPKVWFLWVSTDMPNVFWPPPVNVEDPHPTGRYPDPIVWICALLCCLNLVSPFLAFRQPIFAFSKSYFVPLSAEREIGRRLGKFSLAAYMHTSRQTIQNFSMQHGAVTRWNVSPTVCPSMNSWGCCNVPKPSTTKPLFLWFFVCCTSDVDAHLLRDRVSQPTSTCIFISLEIHV